ncbi:MAG: hypothetical protein AAF502_16345 [Bacteroidota bacterium]
MKFRIINLVAFFIISFMTTINAQHDPQYTQYTFNPHSAAKDTTDYNNNSSPHSFSNTLFVAARETGSETVEVTPLDALIIINFRDGQIVSLEGKQSGKPLQFKEVERKSRGTHHAFVKFETNGGALTATLTTTSEPSNRQQNRRVQLSILKN